MKGHVYYNNRFAGILEKAEEKFSFKYDEQYINDKNTKSISLSLPKSKRQFHSKFLFPFFYGLLTEGVTKQMQCRKLKIDENDFFTRLLKTAGQDTIGCITIKEEK
ncbi:MAG: HipA N-terminal domain-containing protein [Candidatus Cloacimonetes bacterium]|nr:HipA N-terminal domain-containing protein [Candidatus Cloacimonadota bacterium]